MTWTVWAEGPELEPSDYIIASEIESPRQAARIVNNIRDIFQVHAWMEED